MEFLEAMINPFHEEHESVVRWYGKRFELKDIDERWLHGCEARAEVVHDQRPFGFGGRDRYGTSPTRNAPGCAIAPCGRPALAPRIRERDAATVRAIRICFFLELYSWFVGAHTFLDSASIGHSQGSERTAFQAGAGAGRQALSGEGRQ